MQQMLAISMKALNFCIPLLKKTAYKEKLMCKHDCEGVCKCRENAVNIFSKDYKAGELQGRRAEAERTAAALIELERAEIITNAQLQSILDLILEKLLDAKDID
jgi:hypothetical protein